MKCPQCDFNAPDAMKFCGMCGAVLVKACPNCQAENPLYYRFCGMCGAAFIDADSSLLPVSDAAQTIPSIQDESALPAEPLMIEGERKMVTAVITDVTSSTRLLEQLGNENWVELMNRVLNEQEEQVMRFGGVVDQFRGDGMVAFFGADEAHEDDPERAILAALAIMQAVRGIEQSYLPQTDLKLQLRIGINTGEVIIGGKGAKRQEELAMGIGITIAARLEAQAEPGTILVSENTYRLTKEQFEWLPMGQITVRGLSAPLAVYRPLALKPSTEIKSRLASIDFSVPIIGKEKEFEIMKGAVRSLAEGRGGILLLSAETGMGKSFIINRLLQYFLHQEDLLSHLPVEQRQVTPAFYRGRCRSFSNTWPYSMWIDLLIDWLGVSDISASRQEVKETLFDRCQQLWGDDFGDYYPYLATLLSIPLEDEYAQKTRYLDAAGLSEQFQWALRGWIEAMTLQGPMVLIFTDLQWADTSSIEVLQQNLAFVEGVYASEARGNGGSGFRHHPVLYLLSMRPDRNSPAWELRYYLETQYPHRLTMITLSHLDQEQGERFLNSLLGEGVLPDEAMRLIVKNSEGNPYYMVEYVRSLVENGALVQDYETGRWRLVRPITNLEIPANLQQLFQARIDQLTPEARQVLQLASVIGPVFWFNVLQHLVSENNSALLSLSDCLAKLLRENLIRERSQVVPLGMEYVFSSALVRETAYESLLNSQRVATHLRVAAYLEEEAGLENNRQYDGLIAYHYGRGGNTRKELFFTMQAAEAARQVYANSEALGHCNRALEILREMEAATDDEGQRYVLRTQIFDVLKMRQNLHYILGEVEAGHEDGRALLPLAEQMADDPAWMIDALLMQPEVIPDNRQDLPVGLEKARKALALARQIGDRYREMFSLMAVARISYMMGDPQAAELGQQAFELARELGDAKAQIDLLLALRDTYGMDDVSKSDRYLEEALDICSEKQDRLTELRLLAAMGDRLEREGDYYRLLVEIHQKRLQISREIGYRLEEGFAHMYCAQIQGLYLGDYENAYASAEESFKLTYRLVQSLFPLLRLAQFQIILGKTNEAQHSLEKAQSYAERGISDIGRAGFWLVKAILGNHLRDEASLNMALQACENVWKLGDQNRVSRQYIMAASCEACAAYLGLAKLATQPEAAQKYLRRALETSTGAYDIYQKFGFVQIIECTSEEVLFRHSLALEANGHLAEARQFLQRAFQEMMRKYELIPPSTPYRKTYLENMALHREIKAKYEATFRLRRRRKATRSGQTPPAQSEDKLPVQ